MNKNNSIVVLELSSQQLEGLNFVKKSPDIAVITNIYPDHLNRYKRMGEYKAAKKTIFKYQKKSDILLLNYDNQDARNFAKEAEAKVYFFGRNLKKTKKRAGFEKQNQIFFDAEKEPVINDKILKIEGGHNISNLLAAVSVAKLLKVSSAAIAKALSEVETLPGRQKFVAKINGIDFFNDTAATMPDATIAGIKFFAQKFPKANIVLICGGEDKGLSYKKLAQLIAKKVNKVVLMPGSATIKIEKELNNLLRTKLPLAGTRLRASRKTTNIISVNSMQDAVRSAFKLAETGDIILFSPASASFNMFKNEFDRGDSFEKEVNYLK
jgi:UDP-N-acetylmuramoylalanine--D-glutamate ligase